MPSSSGDRSLLACEEEICFRRLSVNRGRKENRWRNTLLLVVHLLVGGALALSAVADGPVRLVVLREQGAATASLAQPFLDRFVEAVRRENGWAAAEGRYFRDRSEAEAWLTGNETHYAIVSFGAYLALREKYGLSVLGSVVSSLAGGQRYFLVSRSIEKAEGCLGRVLVSDHLGDPVFVDRVVFAGAFRLADFTLQATRRPMQTLRKLLGGEADCALVDDAQRAEMGSLEGGDSLRVLWESSEFPPLVIAAFPRAGEEARERFRASFAKACEGAAREACAEVGLLRLVPGPGSLYGAQERAYGEGR